MIYRGAKKSKSWGKKLEGGGGMKLDWIGIYTPLTSEDIIVRKYNYNRKHIDAVIIVVISQMN